MTTGAHLLRAKADSTVFAIFPNALVDEAIKLMPERSIVRFW